MYACGIIMWELQSRRRPFAELNPFQVINLVGMNGKRLEMPQGTAPLWCALAGLCWESEPRLRPSFAQLEEVLMAAEAEVEQQQGEAGGSGTDGSANCSKKTLEEGAGMAALQRLRERATSTSGSDDAAAAVVEALV